MRQHTLEPAPTPDRLLDSYRPGDGFFSGPGHALHTRGALARLQSLEQIPEALDRAGPGAVALGALPFDPDRPAHVLVPETVRYSRAPATGQSTDGPRWQALHGQWDVTCLPEPEEHADAVARAVKTMTADPDLRKVVLARCLQAHSTRDVEIARVLANLLGRDPGAFVFAAPLPEDGHQEAPTLLGASPELLVAKQGGHVVSNPLAGSAPRSADPTKDQRRAVGLLTSDKDRHEHAVVVEAVARALEPYCTDLQVPEEPELVSTATMWHLSTRVHGRLSDPDVPAHVLAAALHPTPAVCGSPTDRAFSTIGQVEPFDRGFYTGAVGYTDASGDGQWVVAIRCADVVGPRVRLYAGGGVMPDSDPEAELAETSAKLRTLLLALGVDETA